MIPPRSTVTPFFVQFLANGSDMAFSTILRVYTNASIFTVPIHCFDGKLKVSRYVAFRNHVCTCTFRPQNGLASHYKSRTLHSSKLKVLVILLNREVCHIVSSNLHSLDFQFQNSVVWQWLVICNSVITRHCNFLYRGDVVWTINIYLVVLFQYVVNGLEEDVVDYGTVGTGENRTKLLKIYNSNPIEVQPKTLLEHICQVT